MSDTTDIETKGFDRGIDYVPTKKLLVDKYNSFVKTYNEITDDTQNAELYRRRLLNRIVYLLIAMVQLRNGSRISEAVAAFSKFMKDSDKLSDKFKVMVKISKSESKKYDKDGDPYMTKPRYRKIKFPYTWITLELLSDIKVQYNNIQDKNLKKRVLDFLRMNFRFNTHSLRYAFINYMIYVEKRPINDVAKHVGHANISQLVTYTQQKNSDQIFDLDI
jgi:hypothetical protein